MVMVLSAATLLTLTGVLSWTSTNMQLSARNNEYYRTVSAAESATEKVIAAMEYDYQTSGDLPVRNNVASYKLKVPTAAENSLWSDYLFSDGQGNGSRTWVEYIPPTEFRVLAAQYRGLYGYASVFRVISNARDTTSRFNITGGVWQDVETATIPLFQFAIFYNLDLEINPGPVMTVTGPVHSNQKIYLQPGNVLTFQDDVTSAGDIINNKKPGDPLVRSGGSIVFEGGHDGGISTLNLPIGTNNSTAAVRQVVEKPPVGELPGSPMGLQRYYNKADLIVTISSAGAVTVTSGLNNNFATVIPQREWDPIIDFTSFYNKREAKTVNAVEVNVANLRAYNAMTGTNNSLKAVLPSANGGDVTLIYVLDNRTQSASTQAGVRVVNGERLPDHGLTVATPAPMYVKGNYNITDATGTSSGASTLHTKPASLIGDAITILSTAWSDANASAALSSRLASSTTVNAAILAGVVETTTNQYSGGVENFPRFLEDWNGDTLTYNGSMVVMYPSQVALGLWQGTGSTIGIYNPPVRSWAFDMNFRDPAKLPPGTPSVRVLIRGAWAMVRPGTTDIVNPNELLP